ncbi:MAG: FtsX-like permease family protein [Candidatus Heimdallarchaeota archaeon]|nr:FtsX-like permease family protein [Candidatus Heimdallarchaeota archaeon]MBY8994353.1 FtsX-like permease family protein [Candidatus Heimdallarchaeota archaeon]
MVFQTIRFALKNAFRKKLVAALSITGIAIGIALMVALSSASAGFDTLLGDVLAQTVGDVEVQEYNTQLTLSQLPMNISDIIRTIDSSDKIIALSPEVVVNNFIQFADNVTIDLGVPMPPGPDMGAIALGARGVNPEDDATFEGPTTKIVDGRLFENDYEVIIADYILEGGSAVFTLGESVDLNINYTYTIPITIVGVFDAGEEFTRILEPSFLMSVNTSLLINTLTLPFEQTGYNKAKIRFDSESLDETAGYIAELEELEPKLSVTGQGAEIESMGELMTNFQTFQTILTVIVIVAGGMAIVVAQLMGVNERMKEFAIMKATGWKNRSIFFDIILESITIGLIGALVGFALGGGLIFFVQLAAGQVFVTVTWQITLQVLAYGLGLGLAGGLIPGIRAARIKPMEVLRAT